MGQEKANTESAVSAGMFTEACLRAPRHYRSVREFHSFIASLTRSSFECRCDTNGSVTFYAL